MRASGCRAARSPAPNIPTSPPIRIIVHPDVRRMLLTMRAYTEGCRALAGWVARQLDEMERADRP